MIGLKMIGLNARPEIRGLPESDRPEMRSLPEMMGLNARPGLYDRPEIRRLPENDRPEMTA